MAVSARKRYSFQKGHAKRRKIGFVLTFEQWWKVWQDSGKWAERGRLAHQYCMARNGDRGDYALGNVKIITVSDNVLERVFSEATRRKIGQSKIGNRYTRGTKLSAQTRSRMSAAKIGNRYRAKDYQRVGA